MVRHFMAKHSILITNDDGIDSPFLAALVRALLQHDFDAHIVAPDGQRSWISKAMTRTGSIDASRCPDERFGCPAWAVAGTPADCVNLALGHLVETPIRLVVSGINIGSNAGLPLILASGTVGGALEGALHGTHAVAASLRLLPDDFARVSEAAPDAPLPPNVAAALTAAADHTAELCRRVAALPLSGDFLVHNLNFPPQTTAKTRLHRTIPAPLRAGPLFSRHSERRDGFGFAFNIGGEEPTGWRTDRECLEAGLASHSILDYGNLGRLECPAFGPVDSRPSPPA
ncbi:MAG: 5'/3'-nucleotidase SurE [Verrucomicrobia bacterium]|nr:MAG: 5'/3'-nucleotidase SurE [Verrucomicrobiota bacterium]